MPDLYAGKCLWEIIDYGNLLIKQVERNSDDSRVEEAMGM